jgi:hypothetical protein
MPLPRRRCDIEQRAQGLERRFAHDRVDFADLRVGETRVRLGERCQSPLVAALVPDGERVVGVETCAPAVATLRMDEHHFHSTSQSSTPPSVSIGTSSGWARKNG